MTAYEEQRLSVSAGSSITEAKLGKALSRTTCPREFSEFGESYGRREDLVEPFKIAIDGLRRGKKDNKTDAPFPSLSPMIINGNPPFTFKGELLKLLHVARFSEEDSNDNHSIRDRVDR